LTYNYKHLDKDLKNNSFKVEACDGEWTFYTRGIKDFVAYQNIAKIIDSLLKQKELFNDKNIKHFHCVLMSTLTVDLFGTCKAYQEKDLNLENLQIISPPCQKIAIIKNVTSAVSLNKQPTSFLKTK